MNVRTHTHTYTYTLRLTRTWLTKLCGATWLRLSRRQRGGRSPCCSSVWVALFARWLLKRASNYVYVRCGCVCVCAGCVCHRISCAFPHYFCAIAVGALDSLPFAHDPSTRLTPSNLNGSVVFLPRWRSSVFILIVALPFCLPAQYSDPTHNTHSSVQVYECVGACAPEKC